MDDKFLQEILNTINFYTCLDFKEIKVSAETDKGILFTLYRNNQFRHLSYDKQLCRVRYDEILLMYGDLIDAIKNYLRNREKEQI